MVETIAQVVKSYHIYTSMVPGDLYRSSMTSLPFLGEILKTPIQSQGCLNVNNFESSGISLYDIELNKE